MGKVLTPTSTGSINVLMELRSADVSCQSCGGLETGIHGWFEALEASPSHSLVPATIHHSAVLTDPS